MRNQSEKQSEEDAIHIESCRRSQSSILMKHLPHSGNILSIFQMVETSTTFRGNPVNIYGPHSPPMYMLIRSLLYFQQGGRVVQPYFGRRAYMGLPIVAGQIVVL
jgi:hypothetical protein